LQLAVSKANARDLSRTCTVHLIEVVLNAIYYNQDLALSWLQANGALEIFFEKWFKNGQYLSRVHDRKLAGVVLMQLMHSEPSRLPADLQAAYPKFLQELVKIIEGMPGAEEDKKKLQEEFELSDDEDDDGYEPYQGDYEDLSDLDDEDGDDLKKAANRNNSNDEDNNNNNDDQYDDWDDDDDDWNDGMWSNEEADEIFMETILDPLNLYAMFLESVNCMMTSKPALYAVISQAYAADPESKKALEKAIALAQKKMTTPTPAASSN
jgi:hypothetical protein